jgi:phosphoribosylformylglycinamidine synthase
MSAKSGTGMYVDLNKVPLREQSMSAYEIMLSESQERMLVVVKPENVKAIQDIFEKWDLQAAIIGEVTNSGNVVIDYQGERVADIPAQSLALGGNMTPVYHRETKEPAYLKATGAFDPSTIDDVSDAAAMLRELIGTPNIASKRWVFQQYDSMVRTNSLYLTGSDSAVVRVKGTTKGIAMKTDCNSRYVYLDPYHGAMMSVVEAARNVACTGALPLGVTNCLNFGNPYDPEVYWQFKEAIRGMGDACKALDTPVTGGNVSFYNESPEGAIYPTPTIGMIGLIEDITKVVSSDFKCAGDDVILLSVGDAKSEFDGIGGSEYLRLRTGKITGLAPEVNIEKEVALVKALVELADAKLLRSAHDVSEGGFAVALAECTFGQSTDSPIGARVKLAKTKRLDTALFAERQGLVILSTDPANTSRVIDLAKKHGLSAEHIGQTGGDRVVIDGAIDESIEALQTIYSGALSTALGEVEVG